jgi:succinoglycan biosynthesis transport protein ExoP
MNLIDLIRLLRKHMVILLLTPVLLAVLVAYFTRNPKYQYSSETTVYTGIASGSSVEMDKSFSYFANNTAFDNLINVINSRETQQEVSIRLLAQHLMLEKCDPRYISKESFDYVRKITPNYVKALVVKPKNHNRTDTTTETTKNDTIFSFSKLYATSPGTNKLQAPIDQDAFEQTVTNLTKLATSSDTNFVYRMLYFDTPHYSLKEISTINAQRIGSSDLVKLKFTSDDPGIVQQTLVFLTDVCIKNFKDLKENRSDAVVKYFEFQVNQATQKLKAGEEKLLSFNMNNNIINYYEQSKAVAIAKEALDVDFNNMKIKLAGTEAAIKRLEDKLDNQQKIQLKSGPVLEKRNQLSLINSKIATIETVGQVGISKIRVREIKRRDA